MDVIMVEPVTLETPVTTHVEVISLFNNDKQSRKILAEVSQVERNSDERTTKPSENSTITNKTQGVNRSSESVVEITGVSACKPPPTYTRYDHRRMSNEDLANVQSLVSALFGTADEPRGTHTSPIIVNDPGLMVISNGYQKAAPLQSPSSSSLNFGNKEDLVQANKNRRKILSIPLNSDLTHTHTAADLSPNSRSPLPAIAEVSFETDDTESLAAMGTQVKHCSFAGSKINLKEKSESMSNGMAVSLEIQATIRKSEAQDVVARSSTSSKNLEDLKKSKEDIKVENNSPIGIVKNISHEIPNDVCYTENVISVEDSKCCHKPAIEITPITTAIQVQRCSFTENIMNSKEKSQSISNRMADSLDVEANITKPESLEVEARCKTPINTLEDSKKFKYGITIESKSPITIGQHISHETSNDVCYTEKCISIEDSKDYNKSAIEITPILTAIQVQRCSYTENKMNSKEKSQSMSNGMADSLEEQANITKPEAQEVDARCKTPINNLIYLIKSKEGITIENKLPITIGQSISHESPNDVCYTDNSISVEDSKDCEKNTIEIKPITTAIQVQCCSFTENQMNSKERLQTVSNGMAVSLEVQSITRKPEVQEGESWSKTPSNHEDLNKSKANIKVENKSPIIIVQNSPHKNPNDECYNNNCISVEDSKDYHKPVIEIMPSKCHSVKKSTKDANNLTQTILDRKQSHTAMTCILHIDNSTASKPKGSDSSILDCHSELHPEDNVQQLNHLSVSKHKKCSYNNTVNESVSSLKDSIGLKIIEISGKNNKSDKENKEIHAFDPEKVLYKTKAKIIKEEVMLQPIQKHIDTPPTEPHCEEVIYINDKPPSPKQSPDLVVTDTHGITVHNNTKEQVDSNGREKHTSDICTSSKSSLETLSTKDRQPAEIDDINNDDTCKQCSTGFNRGICNCKQNNGNDSTKQTIVLIEPVISKATVPATSHVEVIVQGSYTGTSIGNMSERRSLYSNIHVVSASEDKGTERNGINLRSHRFRRHSTPALDTEPLVLEPNSHLNNTIPLNNVVTEGACTIIETSKIYKDREQSTNPTKHNISDEKRSNLDKFQSSVHALLHRATIVDNLSEIPTEHVKSPRNIDNLSENPVENVKSPRNVDNLSEAPEEDVKCPTNIDSVSETSVEHVKSPRNMDNLRETLVEHVKSPTNPLKHNKEETCIDHNILKTNENTNVKSKDMSNCNNIDKIESSKVSICHSNAKSHSLLEKYVLKLNLKPFFIKRNKINKNEETLPNSENINNFEVRDNTSPLQMEKVHGPTNSAAEDVLPKDERESSTTELIDSSSQSHAQSAFQVDDGSSKNDKELLQSVKLSRDPSLPYEHDCNEMLTLTSDEDNSSVQQVQVEQKSRPTIDIVSVGDHVSEEERQATFLQFSPGM